VFSVVEQQFYKQLDTIIILLLLLLLLLILFHDCWNLQMCWMYGCAFEIVFTTSFGITYTTCHLHGMKQTPRMR